MNDVPCCITHIYVFKRDHLVSRVIRMYYLVTIKSFSKDLRPKSRSHIVSQIAFIFFFENNLQQHWVQKSFIATSLMNYFGCNFWLLHLFATWETCKESYFHRPLHCRILAWSSSVSYTWHCSWSCKLTPLSIIFRSNHLWSKTLRLRSTLEWIKWLKDDNSNIPMPIDKFTQSCGWVSQQTSSTIGTPLSLKRTNSNFTHYDQESSEHSSMGSTCIEGKIISMCSSFPTSPIYPSPTMSTSSS
jgi:hypothetical protein